MDWNGGINLKTFATRPTAESSLSFLYNCNYDQYSGVELRQPSMSMSMSTETLHGMLHGTDKNINYGNLNMEKKKRMTNDQLESLERSFLEEVKLDPDRKMKLSRELGLQPRQIAVWFQNRRARWKAKQLERLYDGLKQEFDVISREKHRLQEEVMKLKSLLRDQRGIVRKQVTSTDVSGEETVESTSEAIRSSSNNMIIKPKGAAAATTSRQHQVAECSYLFGVEDYSNPAQPFWSGVPNLPPSFP